MIPLPTVNVLDSITIPVTCPVSWDAMHGDNRTRFCDKCSQNVHDVSELTTAEAMQLLNAPGKHPCLRIYKRQDGRVMTADCATKRERVWKWLHRRSAWAAALFAVIFFGGCSRPVEVMGDPCIRLSDWPEYATEWAARSIAEGVITEAASQRDAEAGR
jgi:hypothetical protein